jgi:nitrile hydratase
MTPTSERFKPGDRVRIRAEDRPGHVRTPSYVKGKTGWVEAVLGEFRNPELLAYGDLQAPKLPLYTVGLRQTDLWEGYAGTARDALYLDVYEHWLEPI